MSGRADTPGSGLRTARHGDVVLVTGANSALGLATTLLLAERGFQVYAGTRAAAKAEEVARAARARGVEQAVAPVELDITDTAAIAGTVERVMREAGGLYGLVNNAGVVLHGPFEELSEMEVRHVMDVNVFGTMAMTRAVLPHLRAAGRGRVVTMSSISGRMGSFALSMYAASKHALEGWSETLAMELMPFGLAASLVEPGIVDSDIWRGHRSVAEAANRPGSPYAPMFRAHLALSDRLVHASRNRPRQVAEAVLRALTDPRPRFRYTVGQPASSILLVRRYLPQEWFNRVYFGASLRQLRQSPVGDGERDGA